MTESKLPWQANGGLITSTVKLPDGTWDVIAGDNCDTEITEDNAKFIVDSVNKAHRMEEVEKLLLMIVERGQLDFDEEGWAFYDKVMKRINTK